MHRLTMRAGAGHRAAGPLAVMPDNIYIHARRRFPNVWECLFHHIPLYALVAKLNNFVP
jgi:hypothetical protein